MQSPTGARRFQIALIKPSRYAARAAVQHARRIKELTGPKAAAL
jgi:hypothetical protein